MSQTTAKRRRSNYRNRAVQTNKQRTNSRRVDLEPLESRTMLTGTWTALSTLSPLGNAGTMELLSDGTVMVSDNNQGWARLTPNSSGSYTSGSWSQLASMSTIRFYDATNVLPDGRVFVLGGEFSGANNTTLAWTNTGEIYNPVTNVWSAITPFPEATFGGPTMVLSDGTVLAGSINGPNTYIYNPATNAWSNGPTKLFNDSSKFETWTKLPDGSILFVRHVRQSGSWCDRGPTTGSHDDDLGRCRHGARGVGEHAPFHRPRRFAPQRTSVSNWRQRQHRAVHTTHSRRWHQRPGKLGCRSSDSRWLGRQPLGRGDAPQRRCTVRREHDPFLYRRQRQLRSHKTL